MSSHSKKAELANIKKRVIGSAWKARKVINSLNKVKIFSICNIKYDSSDYEVLGPWADTTYSSAILHSKHKFVFQICEIIVTLNTVMFMSTDMQGCINSKWQVTVTKFFIVVPNICGSSVWNLLSLHFWYLEFWGHSYIFGKFMRPWLYATFCSFVWVAITVLCFNCNVFMDAVHQVVVLPHDFAFWRTLHTSGMIWKRRVYCHTFTKHSLSSLSV
jgi:hypothetical protein